jgi:ATP-dependent Lhr-like helicase
VVIVNGRAAAWIGRGDRQMVVCIPDDEPERSRIGKAMARELVAIAHRAPEGRRGWLVEEINGKPAIEDASSPFLIEAGFASTGMGLQLRVPRRPAMQRIEEPEDDDA